MMIEKTVDVVGLDMPEGVDLVLPVGDLRVYDHEGFKRGDKVKVTIAIERADEESAWRHVCDDGETKTLTDDACVLCHITRQAVDDAHKSATDKLEKVISKLTPKQYATLQDTMAEIHISEIFEKLVEHIQRSDGDTVHLVGGVIESDGGTTTVFSMGCASAPHLAESLSGAVTEILRELNERAEASHEAEGVSPTRH